MTATASPPTAVPRATPRLAVRVRRVPGVPVVAARIWLRGGARAEETPAQAYLAGRLLAEGSRRRGWQEITTQAEDRGMLIHAAGTGEALVVAIDALAHDWELALEWLAELALEPAFPEDRFRWARRQAENELDNLADQPDARTARAFLEQLYRPHPFCRPLQGDRASLERLDPEACRRLHRRALAWGGCVVVTGDVDEGRAESRARELFGELAGHAEPLADPPRAEGGGERQEIELPGSEQAHLILGHLTVARNHPDLVALEVAAVTLGAGAGLAGRLPERVREREGLAYGVGVATASGAGLDPGRLLVHAGVAPASAERAERVVREELERLITEGLATDELEEVRSYLLGREPFRRETARQWADLLAEAELYGLPTDRPEWIRERLEALTRADVEAAIRRWIRPAELKVTLGLPAGR